MILELSTQLFTCDRKQQPCAKKIQIPNVNELFDFFDRFNLFTINLLQFSNVNTIGKFGYYYYVYINTLKKIILKCKYLAYLNCRATQNQSGIYLEMNYVNDLVTTDLKVCFVLCTY